MNSVREMLDLVRHRYSLAEPLIYSDVRKKLNPLDFTIIAKSHGDILDLIDMIETLIK